MEHAPTATLHDPTVSAEREHAPIAVLRRMKPVPVALPSARDPMATLHEPDPITELPALYPTAVFEFPFSMDDKTEHPTAVLQRPVVSEVRMLQPTPVVVVPEHPYKIPRNVGVASEGVTVPQQMPLVAVEQASRAWPSVPTVNVVGVLAAVPVMRSPLAVTQVLGM